MPAVIRNVPMGGKHSFRLPHAFEGDAPAMLRVQGRHELCLWAGRRACPACLKAWEMRHLLCGGEHPSAGEGAVCFGQRGSCRPLYRLWAAAMP